MQNVDYPTTRKAAATSLKVTERTIDRYIKEGLLSYKKSRGRIWLSAKEISEWQESIKKSRLHKGIKEAKSAAYTQGRQRSRQQGRHKMSIENDVYKGVYPTSTSADSRGQYAKFSEEKFIDGFVKISEVDKKEESADPLGREQKSQSVNTSSFAKKPPISSSTHISPSNYKIPMSTPANATYLATEPVYKKLYYRLLKRFEKQQRRLEGANYKVGELEAKVAHSIPLLDYQKEVAKFHQLESGLKEKEETRKKEITELNQEVYVEKINRYVYIVLLFVILALQPILWILLRKP